MWHLAWVLADYSGTLDLSNRTELRARFTQGVTVTPGQSTPPNPSMDLADSGTALLRVRSRRTELSLGYSLLGLLGDVELGGVPQVIQSMDARATWHERRVRLQLAETASYGIFNSAYLLAAPASAPGASGGGAPMMPPPATPAVQQLAPPTSVQFGSSRTSLASELRLARRWLGSMLVEYGVTGGVDATSRATLPQVSGPRAEGEVDFQATRIDSLATRAAVLHSDTSTTLCSPVLVSVNPGDNCAPTGEVGDLRELWRHSLTREDTGTLGGGVSYVQARLRPADSFTRVVYPVGFAGFEHVRGKETSRSVFRLDAQLAPAVDLRTGAIDERAQTTASFVQRLGPVVLGGSLAAARSVESPFINPITVFQAATEVNYAVNPVISVGGGLRYAWQNQDPLGTFSGGLAVVQITLRPAQIHF